MNFNTKNVAYIVSQPLLQACDKIPIISRRASMVHSLIQALGLVDKLKVISPRKAKENDIRSFHSEEYVEYLKKSNTISKDEEDEEEADNFGLGFDCPVLQGMWPMVEEVAGGSICAAEALTDLGMEIAINWCGGWHHAQRDSASGFCYVNDVVLAIHKLRSKFDKILYIDLDVHHGDGIENAFLFSPKVMTLSLHQLESGFFPGTGKIEDVGLGRGRFYTVNVPYKPGITDSQMNHLFESVLYDVCEIFKPNAVVCQCGADTLVNDPLGEGNITLKGYLDCVKHVLRLNKPTMLLGGGGYNKANTAKLWTAITLMLLNEEIPEEIPEHMFFPMYGPDFMFEIRAGLRKSENTQQNLDKIIKIIHANLKNLKEIQQQRNQI